jgi:predicted RNA-binding Zn ribbon-like protein
MTLSTPKANANRTDWRDGFLFVGNQLALDLLNTRLVMKGEPLELIPDLHALLRWSRAAGLLSSSAGRALERRWGHSHEASQVVPRARRFRERLREEVLRLERGRPVRAATLEEVNRWMAEFPMRKRLKRSHQQPMLEEYFDPWRPGELLAPIVHAAALLLATIPVERVRKCASCVAHFYDDSKKGNRRWCSMQICGNRQKVAAYAARHRPSQ